jgi:hypothetical protein
VHFFQLHKKAFLDSERPFLGIDSEHLRPRLHTNRKGARNKKLQGLKPQKLIKMGLNKYF